MADIEMVIKIPETLKRIAKEEDYKAFSHPIWLAILMECIWNGTELPKGHGRLGDLDKIKKEMQNYYDDCATTSEYTRLGFETAIAVVEDAPTIIEADKENKNEENNM